MNDPSQMMNRGFGMWPPPLPPPSPADHSMVFPNPARPQPPFAGGPAGPNPGRMSWKGRKAADKRKKLDAAGVPTVSGGMIPVGGIAGAADGGMSGYNPPASNDLQLQNRVNARSFYPKKKYARFAPFAPRNTSSYIIRAKKSGGIASLVSPCPLTPAILPTPRFSPSREGLSDMVKEEWGVDGYGTMKGLIRLRSPNGSYEIRSGANEDEEEEDSSSSESDVEEHLEVERRLDHDVSRFEMVYPGGEEPVPATAAYLLENRVDDQDTHIARLAEENLTLKERLFLMEQEMKDMRRRLQVLENNTNLDAPNSDHNNSSSNNENAAEAASENEGVAVAMWHGRRVSKIVMKVGGLQYMNEEECQ